MTLATIAVTGERFVSFGPYVASVSDAGHVAFQAVRTDGTHTVCRWQGEGLEEIPLAGVAAVTSHPDVNRAGDLCFYGDDDAGRPAVYVLRQGRLRAYASDFRSIGPAGPTMNEAGVVAFRAERTEGVPGVHAVGDAGVRTVAERDGTFHAFHGLPLVDSSGAIVFRADRVLGTSGIYRQGDAAGAIETLVGTDPELPSIAAFPCLTHDGAVAFAGADARGRDGVFLVRDGTLQRVAGGEAFDSHRGCLASGRTLIRIATPHGGALGLFAGADPDADRIVGVGDRVEGSTVAAFAANPVSGGATGDLAVVVGLTDGREAIVLAHVG